MALEWSEERYGTGFQVLDERNRALVCKTDELRAALERGASTRQVEELILFLWDHISMQFAREERLLRAAAIPDSYTHIKQHRRFARELEYFRRSWYAARGDHERASVLLKWLESWVTHHVGSADLAFRGCQIEDEPPRPASEPRVAA